MKKYLLSLICLLTSYTAHAQNIIIDADQKVEWYRDEQKIIAYGNAVATKGNNILKGNKLTAVYETVQLEDKTQKDQLQKIFSDENVWLNINGSIGTGTHFEYDLPTAIAKLTGNPAKLQNETGDITATNGITYYKKENKSIALGNVIIKNDEYTIYANKMISYFESDKQGQNSIKRVEIYADNQPIKIINKQAEVTGKRGIYLPREDKIKIYENVVINQNNDILRGNYAETDLKTGISRLLGQENKSGRVTGIFHNKKKK
ncbi:MAG: hypothetical protein IJ660_00115 [Alphaproteobacteria bacterium]|nr:hypothetical protein [Alphaproteobacteria bacterium]